MTVTNILGLTSIAIFYLFMVSPRDTGVNLFTLTSLTSYDQAERLLPTFINVFFLFLHEKSVC